MAVNVETLEKLERKMTLTLPVSVIQSEVDSRLKKLARTVKMDGFRPGKVPMNVVAQRYGYSVHYEVMNDKVGEAFATAANEANLRVAGQPRITEKEDGADGQLSFDAVFEVYPDVAIGEFAEQKIERPTLTVGDAEVDKTLDILRKPAGLSLADHQRIIDQVAHRHTQNISRALAAEIGQVHRVLKIFGGTVSNGMPYRFVSVEVARNFLVLGHACEWVRFRGVSPFPGFVPDVREQGQLAIGGDRCLPGRDERPVLERSSGSHPGIAVLSDMLRCDGVDRSRVEHGAQFGEFQPVRGLGLRRLVRLPVDGRPPLHDGDRRLPADFPLRTGRADGADTESASGGVASSLVGHVRGP